MNTPIKRLFICATSVMALASCGGGNDVASGGAGTGVTSASAVSASTSAVNENNSARTSVSPTMAALDKIGNGSRNSTNIIKAAYVDNWAPSGVLGSIPAATYATLDIVLGAFPDLTTTSISQSMLTNFQIAYNANPNVKLFISIGGQNSGKPAVGDVPNIVSTIMSQISGYNSALGGGKIVGVDLDLENATSADTISALALAFKQKGLLVSVAPQAYNLTGSGDTSPTSPTNFSFTSGGSYFGAVPPYNQFGPAIASGNVDYLMLQSYNAAGWTIGNCNETQICFVSNLATALSNLVSTSAGPCTPSPGYAVCIPQNVKILITEVASNDSSGIANANIFGNAGVTQATVLDSLKSAISAFPAQIAGVGIWELAKDYISGTNSSLPGAFSTAIFGAPAIPPPPPSSAFALTIKNTGTKNYVGAMLTSPANAYNPFGDASNMAIGPGQSVCAGTSTTTKANCYSNTYLNTYFAAGASSVTLPAISVYDFASSSSVLNKPDNGWSGTQCLGSTTFTANTTLTLSINGDNNTCTITSP
jgi:hypothetical protein